MTRNAFVLIVGRCLGIVGLIWLLNLGDTFLGKGSRNDGFDPFRTPFALVSCLVPLFLALFGISVGWLARRLRPDPVISGKRISLGLATVFVFFVAMSTNDRTFGYLKLWTGQNRAALGDFAGIDLDWGSQYHQSLYALVLCGLIPLFGALIHRRQ